MLLFRPDALGVRPFDSKSRFSDLKMVLASYSTAFKDWPSDKEDLQAIVNKGKKMLIKLIQILENGLQIYNNNQQARIQTAVITFCYEFRRGNKHTQNDAVSLKLIFDQMEADLANVFMLIH